MKEQIYKQWDKLLLAIDLKGEVISDISEYRNMHSKLKFRCRCGHEWKTTYQSIQRNNSWCKKCSRIEMYAERNINSWKNLQNKIEGRFNVLTKFEDYKGIQTLVSLQCVVCGNISRKKATTQTSNKCGCIVCNKDTKRRMQWKKLFDAIGDRGCVITTYEDYKGSGSKVDIKCNCGRLWNVYSSSITCQNTWCPACIGGRLTINEFWNNLIQKIKNKGEIISDISEYKNVFSKLKFKCKCGYEWKTTYESVYRKNSWCKACNLNGSRSENLVRLLFSTYFGVGFYTARPKWNFTKNSYHPNILNCENIVLKIKPKKTNKLELDGYAEMPKIGNGSVLKIAFEYNGFQHYELDYRSKKLTDKIKRYSKQNFNDLVKKQKCAENGVLLYVIPEIHPKFQKDINSFVDRVTSILENQGLKMTFSEKQIEEMKTKFNSL